MQYIRLIWRHADTDLPTEILSEIDDERYKSRKIEVFADGHVQCASEQLKDGDTRLGDVPCPPLKVVNVPGSELTAAYITREEFEARWREITAHRTEGG